MDWFYHAPGQGRVGPLSADDIRNRYRERRIERDTLVWREGLPEWQPLDRFSEEFDLASVAQDSRLPPPLPPPAGSVAVAASLASRVPGYVAPAPKKMSGCLIAFIVLAVVSVPLIGILAAIAIPAYSQYTVRAKVGQQLTVRAAQVKPAVLQARRSSGHCPRTPAEAGIADATDLTVGQLQDGRCAFEVTLRGLKPPAEGTTVIYAAGDDGQWDCTGGSLPTPYRPAACRPAREATP